MKLQQACEIYGLRPASERHEPAAALVEQYYGKYYDQDWVEHVWPAGPQFDEIFHRLRELGQVARRFDLSGVYSTNYKDAWMPDCLLLCTAVHRVYLPEGNSNRALLKHNSHGDITARLQFDLDDPLDALLAALSNVRLL